MSRPYRGGLALLAVLALSAAACSSDDGGGQSAAGPSTTSAGDEESFDVRAFVETLAADDLDGRDNETPGSQVARDLIIGELSQFAEPAFPEAAGDEGYLQEYDVGTNVLAVIPGDDLADEYVMIGGHYDHFGHGDCNPDEVVADDAICNGAADNASGVASAIAIGRSIAADGPPRRSVVLAFWDGEEDGLVGSRMYVETPLVPLDQTIGYVNFDIQGVNLLPSLTNATIVVGAETGGPNLVETTRRAADASPLDTVRLSLLFGQGRSDHAVFAEAGVPTVFFTDANSGCYHTVKDDIDAIDFAKLEEQIATAEGLSRELTETDTPPIFDAAAPPSTYDDAVELLRIVEAAEPDFGLFDAEPRAASDQYLLDLRAVVDAGAESFDDEANATLLGGAVELVSALAELDCDGFVS